MLTDDTVQQMCQSVSEVLAMETALRILASHGYAVVSVEPNIAMEVAGAKSIPDLIIGLSDEIARVETAQTVWRAMIAAAQEQSE